MAQKSTNKYDLLWKKVDELLHTKGLPKSALTEVNKIYDLAKKEKEQAQLIKALLYRIDLGVVETEDAVISSINSLEKETAQAREPVRSILASITAEYYWNYFQMNRWKLYNRTATTALKKEDIATWGIADFHQRISELYLLSIKEDKLLKQTPLAPFDPIIVKGNSRRLRPTLFDLLAHRALAYFKNDERDLTRPAYAFKLDQEEAFAPAAGFIKVNFPAADSTSLQRKALLLYQQLIAFHLKDKDPEALIDIDIERLGFVRQTAVTANKEDLYYAALKKIAEDYRQNAAADRAWYLMARWHADKAAGYDPLQDTSNRYAYLTAHKIGEQVISRNDSSEGAISCYNLLREIEQQQLSHITEKVNVPGKPFRVLVNYRNCFQVHARIVPVNETLRNTLESADETEYWKKLTALKPLRQWAQPLPDTRDYQRHSAEIKIDALPVGSYALLLGGKEDLSVEGAPLSVQFFYVSNIGYINDRNEYFVLHRETGKPLVDATVQVWKNNYDYKLRRTVSKKAEKLVTDNKGYFNLKDSSNRGGNIRLEIDHGKDHLFMNESAYLYYRAASTDNRNAEEYEKDNRRAFLFTDRSIYRPGQTIYFKGIAITKDFTTRKSRILTDEQTSVVLKNTSGEAVDTLRLTTNSFGSYTGSFRLPENMLNGQFYLEDISHRSTIYFRVEEYKRPAFYVDYEKLTGSYRVNDSITLTGTAQAYAGNNIDGAQVRYRVVRQPRFIYFWLFKGRGLPAAPAMEIAQGTTVTDADGKFTVRFKATPDESLNRSLDPVFDYRIIADVTDINGETRSAETTVSVSYKALQLSVQVPGGEALPVDSLRTLLISTANMNGVFESAPITVQIYPLEQPGRLIRPRYWQQPDQYTMSEEEYTLLFPHDEYSNESHKENWLRGKLLTAVQGASKEDRSFTLPPSAAAIPGWYAVEVSAVDKSGETVKDIQYVLLYDEKSNRLPVMEYISSRLSGSSFEPGDKALVTLGSTARDITVIQQITKTGEGGEQTTNELRLFSLDNEKTGITLPVEEADRGGFGVNFFFIKDNRFYLAKHYLSVPWSNKMLSITYETYRDKTLPGSEESWKVKISGSKKEKVAAEMLAGMYDASLDQFMPHQWNVPYLWPVGYPTTNWNGNTAFTGISSISKDGTAPQKKLPVREYDALSTFYSLLNSYGGRIYGNTSPLYMKREAGIAGAKEVQSQNELDKVTVVGYDAAKKVVAADMSAAPGPEEPTAAAEPEMPGTQIRQNFNETAFFLPDLQTDAEGNIAFSFTMPEALTRWKFQALAHTRDLAFGYTTTDLVTQKDLMVQPNAPRFLREGDRMELTTKIVNLSDHEITGTIHLELLNATTLSPVDGIFSNSNAHQYFTVEAGKSAAARFNIEVPYHYNDAVIYRFVAKAEADSAGNSLSDGEEAALPVLTNSLLVTETLPLPVRGNREKQFHFDKLLHAGSSETLQHHALTVEFSSNPAWYAVQALPYLMEYPYECAEQVFNRFYANALASKIVSTSPRIAAIFGQWKTADTAALLSNLQKNPELKSILLEETPWVLEARTESQQKKNIALLFDLVKMKRELESSLDKLKQMQSPNGGFVWFKGGPDDRYITQYILTGIGHLKKLDALPEFTRTKLDALVKAAFSYTDSRLQEDYDKLVKSKASLNENHLGALQIQFLYMRSFFPEAGIPGNILKAVSYYRGQSQRYWVNQNSYMKGMIALQLYRTGDKRNAAAIMKSLQENAVVSDEMGMYWKDNRRSYYWQDAPVETHSLLTEAFVEIINDRRITDNLKTWLLKNKQTNNWGTTKASAEACYALLLQGSEWLEEAPAVTIKLGDRVLSSSDIAEAGTGYFKTRIEPPFIKPGMGEISVQVNSADSSMLPTWGAVYWQYFEQLDKITPAATPLSLSKQLFIERNSDRGPQLQPVTDDVIIKTGDRIKVRIELRVDRNMEYMHMKDMRASCMEPVNVLSSYKWQGGLGYYESTKDAGTHFFFSRLPKGTYVFEYPLLAVMPGNFSNGVTSIQCMYAPEFSSHSEGVRVRVE